MSETETVLENSRRLLEAYKLNKQRKEGEKLLKLLPQGHESGLDADLLDGHHATEIVEKAVRESAKIPVKAFSGGGGLATHGNEFHSPDMALATDIVTGHGALDGLLDDDHTIYFHTDGTDTATGDFDMGLNALKFRGSATCYVTSQSTINVRIGNNVLCETTLKVNWLNYGSQAKFFCATGNIEMRPKNNIANSVLLQSYNGAFVDNLKLINGVCEILGGKLTSALDCNSQNLTNAGDIDLDDGKFVIFDKASGTGVKVDTATPTFGWRDLLGVIRTRGVGATDPNDATYNGNIKAYQFSVNDECWIDYHVPHDYAEGTDIYLHFHWSHNNALVTGGTVTWGADVTYAKGHNQAAFPASVNTTVVGTASTTQYQHIITEIQISASAPSGSQIDSDDLEPDGVLIVRGYLNANNITVSGGAVPEPFLHYLDVHYQSSNIATKNKAPDFYA